MDGYSVRKYLCIAKCGFTLWIDANTDMMVENWLIGVDERRHNQNATWMWMNGLIDAVSCYNLMK